MRWLWTLLFFLLVALVACDDLNRPMGHPKSPSFTPESSTSSTSSTGGITTDAGGGTEGGPANAPTIQPQPGDIQI